MRLFKNNAENVETAQKTNISSFTNGIPTPLLFLNPNHKKELALKGPATVYKLNRNKSKEKQKSPKKNDKSGIETLAANIQSYHWQGGTVSKVSVDDMVLLTKISDSSISDNLKKRFNEDKIYTYIGPVLIAVNPFKQLKYFTEKEVNMYQGAAHYELPPHIYAVSDLMYRNMLSDGDNQCVIISGESGAGKTVSAKLIMDYLTKISGGGDRVQHVKDIILKSNPLLEAFGNAKTIRNNNSSRFGKYIEIMFSRGGEPLGGQIQNFLLEKSRVHSLNKGERNFHIFYQLCSGANSEMKENLGIVEPQNYSYLNSSGVYDADEINDAKEFQDTLQAMSVMGIDDDRKLAILSIVAAILHMGNIPFEEDGNYGKVTNLEYLEFPAYLLGIDIEDMNQKLTSRVFDSKWGSSSEKINVTLNLEQTSFTRDAWTKGLYARLFQYLVETINKAMVTKDYENNVGILDIYGFEIFDLNGFEQFCINYVNEKLQQIFIELTLKSEQEEYQAEGIKWEQIKYFNNEVVCDLIEGRNPPGLFRILDDTCATMSAVSVGADDDFKKKTESQVSMNSKFNTYYSTYREGFTVKHYAGDVSYYIYGFCEKNRDVLFSDIIELMQTSSNSFIRSLFPDDVSADKKRPTTAGAKIRTQANSLVTTLKTCIPSYIRCIKPNDLKKSNNWNGDIVKHQVEYLGLKENVEVKRAGFAYRRPFSKFLHRYAILTKETWPVWRGDEKQGINHIMQYVSLTQSQYQLGRTKVFIKDPESLYLLEECRERKFDYYAKILQRAYRKYYKNKCVSREIDESSLLVQGRKQRRLNSINRNFYYDYIGTEFKPEILKLLPKREKVEFSLTVNKYDRRFKAVKRDMIVTKNYIFLIGREKIKKGEEKGKIIEVVKRKIPTNNVDKICLSRFCDNFVLLCVKDDYESLMEVEFKTELLLVLNRLSLKMCQRPLQINFTDRFDYRVKKIRWLSSGTRAVAFMQGHQEGCVLTPTSSTLTVRVGQGLPADTKPGAHLRQITTEVRNIASNARNSQPYTQNGHLGNMINKVHKNGNLIKSHQNGNLKSHQNGNLNNNIRPITPMIQTNPVLRKAPTMSQSRFPPPPVQPAPEDQPKAFPPPKKPVVPPKKFIKQAKVLYDYDARDTDEISIVAGETIEIVQEDESGWWTCKKQGQKGFCPGNYLEKL